MELEELKQAWVQMGNELEVQKKLTKDIIMDMTKEKYRNKFRTINRYELPGAVVCFIAAIYLFLNYNKLDIWYLQLCGAISITILTVLPLLVLSSIKKLKGIDISVGTYRDNLVRYTKAQTQFLTLQKMGVGLSLVLLFFIVPTIAKITKDKDMFIEGIKTEQVLIFTIVLIGMAIFSRWGYGSYKRMTNSAASLLEELK